jgi:hypothetical protein
MFRLRHVVILGLTLASVLILSGAGLAAPAPKWKPIRRGEILATLNNVIEKYDGITDPKLRLSDVLDDLQQKMNVAFYVNEKAFRDENGGGVPDVMTTPIAEKPYPTLRDVTWTTVLRQLLARVPATSGATYIIRRDVIEITTNQYAKREAEEENAPLVHVQIDAVALEEALRDLAETANGNILIDPRAAEKAKTNVTASLSNVALDTAVELLADMADLKAVRRDNVLYVTTKENGQALEKENEERKSKRLASQRSCAQERTSQETKAQDAKLQTELDRMEKATAEERARAAEATAEAKLLMEQVKVLEQQNKELQAELQRLKDRQ